jgi:dihydroflavonol-4-reductase
MEEKPDRKKNAERTVYITGASGRLGQAVLRRIDAIPLVRREHGLPNEIVTDFSERQLKGILNDADAIIHIAGSIQTLDEKDMIEANVGLTERIVKSAPLGCRIIFASSISVYGKKLDKIPANEKTRVQPDSAYARSKFDAERIAAARGNHVILRIGPIYGPGFEDYFKVLSMIERGKMRIIGNGSNRIPFVHVDDVADAFAASIGKGKGTYVISGEARSQKEIYAIAAKALGVEGPKKSIGLMSASLLASAQGIMYRLRGRKPTLTPEHIDILGYDRAFDCVKARKDLGFSPRPLEHGIIGMVREYRAKKNAL